MITGEKSLQKVKMLQSKLNQEMLPEELRQDPKLEPIFVGADGESYQISEVKPTQTFAVSADDNSEPLPVDI
jgi:hypothetical protein